MLNQHTKTASLIVGVQTLACILSAGFVLTHFRHQAAPDSPGPMSVYSGSAPDSLHSAPRLFILPPNGQYREPRITVRQGAMMAPMIDGGHIIHSSYLPAGYWRIVNMQGKIVASGKIPSDVNYTSYHSGFIVRNTHQITMLSNLPTVVLSVQADKSASKFAGRGYMLEQADEGRAVHAHFYLAAPPPLP